MLRRCVISSLVIAPCLAMSGCSGLVSSLIPKIKPTVTVSSAGGSQIDATQSVTVQAFTENDNGAGVSWSLTAGNPGTLTNPSTTQVTYAAPASVTSATQVTITATSKSDSTVTATLSLTVNPAPTVSGSLPSGTVGIAYNSSLTVNGGVGPYYWTVTGLPNGLTYAQTASTGSTLTISGTPLSEGTAKVAIAVSDSAQPSVTSPADNISLAISPSALTISPASLNTLMELASFRQPLTVTPSATGPFTWTIASGSLPTGVSLNSTTGLLSGTPTSTGPYDFAVQVTDAEKPVPGTGTVTYSGTVQASTVASLLSGQYAFLLHGFDSYGNAAAIIGSFTSDGKGNITTGELDLNDNFTIAQNTSALAGNYTIDTNLRGSVMFTGGLPQGSKTISLAYTLSADGTRGKLISLDANGYKMWGEMQKQDNTAFNASSLNASYAFGLESNTNPRVTAAGQLSIGTNSQVAGKLSQSTSGQSSSSSSVTGSLGASVDTNGRGTISLSTGQTNWSTAFYAVSANKLYLMEIDPSGNGSNILAGQALRQKMPFTSGSPTGTGVFSMTGFDTNNSSQGTVSIVGRLVTDSSGAAKFAFDENASNGAVITTANLAGTISSFDATTGAGTITITGGLSGGLFDQAEFYLFDSGSAFVVDTTPTSATRAISGMVAPQSSGTTFVAPTGNIMGVYGESSSQPPAVADMFLALANQQGDSVADVRSAGKPDQVDQAFTGVVFSPPDSTGRGTATFPAALLGYPAATNATAVYYLGAPNQFLWLNTVANSPSAIGKFDPQ